MVSTNQYGLYESGEVPNLSNGKLLKTVMLSPEAFGELAEDLGDGLGANVRRKIFSRISEARKVSHDEWLANRVFGKRLRNKYNGFAQQSLKVVHDCMLYFVNKMGGTYKTQMNKLLFYTDFISYRTYGMGITGLSYLASSTDQFPAIGTGCTVPLMTYVPNLWRPPMAT